MLNIDDADVVDPNQAATGTQSGMTPLLMSLSHDKTMEFATLLLEKTNVDVNVARFDTGHTPLCVAVREKLHTGPPT